ncbi:MAG: M1 family metallopeptidase [Rhodothermaceae bacterium]
MKVRYIFFAMLFLLSTFLQAQKREITRQDTLRGSVTPERIWWDLTYYHLDIEAKPEAKSLSGSVLVQYKVLSSGRLMQIDLQPPLKITGVIKDKTDLNYTRDGNVYYIEIADKQVPGTTHSLKIFYEGIPKVSKRPPWDGGLTWSKDKNGKDFIATSCQGDGASLWWPCKDHMYDEPDSMLISITAPAHLTSVANGRLRSVKQKSPNTKTAHWFVANPISNYCVNMNIGDYTHFSEIFSGEKGNLDCDYYVLTYNLDKAKKHFTQAPKMLEAFEYWFGPYPFYEDSYKLVEVPYPGMEHQSSVTYGNHYKNGFRGRDVSHSGWGDKFDFIIIHESGHEWFANSITYKDIADMWIHESFTAYSENLYVDYHFGKKASSEYVIGTRKNIRNDRPIIGIYNINFPGSGDMYPKGANMLHNIRQIIDDDEKWRMLLRDINKEFYHQTVESKQIEDFMIKQSGKNLTPIFNQYLRNVKIPEFTYQISDNTLKYKWSNCIQEFNMPVRIFINGNEQWLNPASDWKVIKVLDSGVEIKVDENFYVTSKRLEN